MSSDDFYLNPEIALQEWLSQIDGGFEMLIESIDPLYLPYVKMAFLEGYKIGFSKKTIKEYKEQIQK